jgi:hypothetical protein
VHAAAAELSTYGADPAHNARGLHMCTLPGVWAIVRTCTNNCCSLHKQLLNRLHIITKHAHTTVEKTSLEPCVHKRFTDTVPKQACLHTCPTSFVQLQKQPHTTVHAYSQSLHRRSLRETSNRQQTEKQLYSHALWPCLPCMHTALCTCAITAHVKGNSQQANTHSQAGKGPHPTLHARALT